MCQFFVRLFWAAVPLFLLAPSIASADPILIYGNFQSPGKTYNPSSGFNVSGPSSLVGYYEVAAPFTPAADYNLAQIDVAIQDLSGPNTVALSLTDSSGTLNYYPPGVSGGPGNTLESWTLTNLPSPGSPSSSIVSSQTVVPAQTLLLSAGQTYWIVAQATASDTFATWNQDSTNSPGGTGGTWADNSGAGWVTYQALYVDLAYDVLGETPVPEPGTLALFCAAWGSACAFFGYRFLRPRTQ